MDLKNCLSRTTFFHAVTIFGSHHLDIYSNWITDGGHSVSPAGVTNFEGS